VEPLVDDAEVVELPGHVLIDEIVGDRADLQVGGPLLEIGIDLGGVRPWKVIVDSSRLRGT